jgi:hypothetical protein
MSQDAIHDEAVARQGFFIKHVEIMQKWYVDNEQRY